MYWTETRIASPTILKSLNLTGGASRVPSTIGITVNITSALTQDPDTADLLVCDSQSGDILRCDPMSGSCVVEVDHSSLLVASTNTGISLLASM